MYAQDRARLDPAPIRFQERLGMLTRRVYFHMVRGATRLLAAHEVTVEQYVVLAFLAEEERLTQQDLVRRCASDPRTMGKMLDLLEAKRWLERVPHARDRRAWHIVLTALGRGAVVRMDEALIPLRERPAKVLGSRDLATFQRLLSTLAVELDPALWLPSPSSKSPAKPQKP